MLRFKAEVLSSNELLRCLILWLLQLARQPAHLNMNDWKPGTGSENHRDNEREQGWEVFFPLQCLIMMFSRGPFERWDTYVSTWGNLSRTSWSRFHRTAHRQAPREKSCSFASPGNLPPLRSKLTFLVHSRSVLLSQAQLENKTKQKLKISILYSGVLAIKVRFKKLTRNSLQRKKKMQQTRTMLLNRKPE